MNKDDMNTRESWTNEPAIISDLRKIAEEYLDCDRNRAQEGKNLLKLTWNINGFIKYSDLLDIDPMAYYTLREIATGGRT